MFSGIIRHVSPAVAAVVVTVATLPASFTAAADPSQDQKFFDLLGQQDIPPVDGEDSLVISAKHACAKLDGGMSVGDLVELIRNNGFNDNPLARFAPQDRINRTIDLFLNAAVEAYCPYDRAKIAGIAAYRAGEPPVTSRRVVLTSFVAPLPAGEIAPTKPLPVPAQPAPQVPQEIQPVPEQPPPPQRHTPPAPKQSPPPPQEPPPAEAPQQPPPQEPPPEAAPPAPAAPGGGAGGGNAPAPAAPGGGAGGGNAPAPAAPGGGAGGGNAPAPAAPGGGAGGGNAPASPTPEQPAPAPGHIRLAP